MFGFSEKQSHLSQTEKASPTVSHSSHQATPNPGFLFTLIPPFASHPKRKEICIILHLSQHAIFSSTTSSSSSPESSHWSLGCFLFVVQIELASLTNMAPMLKLFDCCLRLSAIPLCAATIWLTVTNQQENSGYGNLKFSNFMGLKYMICVSAICAGYAFVAALSIWIRFLVAKAWLFFLSDQILAYLMVTSVAAVSEILYLAYNGDRPVTWSEACSSYGNFCNRMKLALVLHASTVCCFVVLAAISAYRAFSMFEPPSVPSEEVDQART